MSKVETLFKRFFHSLTDEEKENVKTELETMDVEEVAEEIAEDIVDTTNEVADTETEADAEAEPEVEDDGEAEGEDAEAEPEVEDDGETEADAEAEPEVEDDGEAEPEVEDDGEAEGEDAEADEDDVFSETEVTEPNDVAEEESVDSKRLTEIEAKLDMIIQMLTTSGPDGTHVPFVNIPGKSHYHDDMDIGEATRVLLTGKL